MAEYLHLKGQLVENKKTRKAIANNFSSLFIRVAVFSIRSMNRFPRFYSFFLFFMELFK
mgnify:CR=1 FL=1